MNNVKNKLNIIGKCFVKENSVNGEILSFVPDVPMMGYLDNYLFIVSIPDQDQKFSSAYIRLQNKAYQKQDEKPPEEIKEFTEVRECGHLKESSNNNDIIVCAPKSHVLVDFNKLVMIATIPSADKFTAPCYFKRKVYDKNKSELEPTTSVVIDVPEDVPGDQIDQIMNEIQQDQS